MTGKGKTYPAVLGTACGPTANLRRVLSGARTAAGIMTLRGRRRRMLRRLWGSVEIPISRPLALAYRVVLLRRVVFIGVTGSTGKTTTKELIAAALASRFEGNKNSGNINFSIHRSIFRARPWHKYYVQETAAAIGGRRVPLERPLRLVRPRIGVVTNIGTDHLSAFGGMDAIAAEKGKLIAALPETGTAILNADDPRVLAMRSRCRGRVITYGLAPGAMIRAENISGSWPDRLSFDVLYGGQRHAVHTQLCGTHWVPCTLAAIAAALAMGVPLAAAARAIEAVPPVEARMEPVARPDGVTFIRDDQKAPLRTMGAALDFMREARAGRKTVVIGTISDYAGSPDKAYVEVANQALDVADIVVFVGPKSHKCLKAKRRPNGEALQAFYSVEAASEYLGGVLRSGDLVLLKGSGGDDLADRMAELLSAEGGRQRPPRSHDGYEAPQPPTLLAPDPAAPPGPARGHPDERRGAAADAPRPERDPPVRAVVGLGNMGERYRDTPHNVGHRVLDRLADSLGSRWERTHGAFVAVAERQGARLYLIKPATSVNDSGLALVRLAREIGFGPADCVLVQDDVDLPLGANRVRMRGGDGGHRGVRSVLEALGTDAIARVKIGVGRSERRHAVNAVAAHVVRPFSPEERAAIDAACARAAESVLELASRDRLVAPPIAMAPRAERGGIAAEDADAWPNVDRLSPFDYWQFWRNVKDADVGRCLRRFTELPPGEIERLEGLQGAEINEAKKVLAFEATRLRHGREAAERAVAAARGIFEGGDGGVEGLPAVEIDGERLRRGVPVIELLRLAGLAASNGDARRLIRGGGVRLNDERVDDEALPINAGALRDGRLKLSAGRKRHVLLRPASVHGFEPRP